MIIKVSSEYLKNDQILLRQTPQLKGSWNNVKFVINKKVERCDWWVVLHGSGLTDAEETMCDPNHIVFVSMEPPDAYHSKRFLDQFSCVVSADGNICHSNVLKLNVTTWWAGIKVKFGSKGHEIQNDFNVNYDSFINQAAPSRKKNRISVITSKKNFWPGHARRLEFLEKLHRHPVSKHIDFFGGWGDSEIEDKLDGLLPYKYHLVLENTCVNDFWTEKLGDPFLAFCLPLYCGSPNLNKYFPLGSYVPIDIMDFEATVMKFEEILNSNLYYESFPMINQARNMILNDYNVFNVLSNICNKPAAHYERVRLLPLKASISERIVHRLQRYFGINS